jgi:hypothetical protein
MDFQEDGPSLLIKGILYLGHWTVKLARVDTRHWEQNVLIYRVVFCDVIIPRRFLPSLAITCLDLFVRDLLVRVT